MPVTNLRRFLDENRVKYVTISHSLAFTAQEVAATAHVPGQELAKTVMIKVDGKMAMAVLPASFKVDLNRLSAAIEAGKVELADELEFRQLFAECEVGAMPPFGNLYGMEVYVADVLAEDEEIAFNAGTHTELIRMKYADFNRLVQPQVVTFAKRVSAAVG
jgi:Ala-tRNA(Pro) deacylase